MKFRSLLVCVLLAIPAVAPGANKDIVDLQREINLLQQKVMDLQKSQDEKFAAVLDLARQSLEVANKANSGVAAVTANLNKTLPAIGESVNAPIAQVNSKLTEIGGDVRALQNAQAELASTLARMQGAIDDINRQVKTINTQPAAPPQGVLLDGPNTATAPVSTTPQNPPMAALDMYNAAYGDYTTSKFDLATQGFNDFLKWYPNHTRAPNAHFYLGMTQYQARNFPTALKEFDSVLEYNGNKMEDAMLFKARALANIPGRKTEAAATFRQLIHDYPKADQALLACDDLKSLGMNCPVAPAAANHGTSKRSSKK